MHNIHLYFKYKGYRQYNSIKIINSIMLKIITKIFLNDH